MNKDLIAIFEYLEREKGIKREIIIAAIEESLKAAARKSIDGASNVTVQIQPKTGKIQVYLRKRNCRRSGSSRTGNFFRTSAAYRS